MGIDNELEESQLVVYKSVRNQKWKQRSYDSYLVESLRRFTSLPGLVSQVLSHYVSTPEEASDYLDPKLKKLLPNPFIFKDMDKAVDVTLQAIQSGKKIVIFGDYDVDGATSAALIKNIMKLYGHDVGVYVPDRIIEGYGLNVRAIKSLRDLEYELIITVDCGASANEEISYAKELGFDVVVLDHHKCGEELPCADAVVNPNRLDDESGYYYLAAVGVSFLFILALHSKMKQLFPATADLNLMHFLDLVALGTVCDVVPLVGLNRAFVRQGIRVMQAQQNVGLKALMAVSGVLEEISVYHLGFVLGPRINAGGRVGESDLGASLLSCDGYEVAIAMATKLDIYNNERKAIELTVLEAAKNQALLVEKDASILMVSSVGWHPGVIGIIAGRLKEIFHKPVAVVSIENGIGKASCRSIEGIDFGSAIIAAKASGLLENGGGHAMAAGFTILQENLPKLKEFLSASFNEDFLKLKENMISHYAATLSVSSIDLALVRYIANMGPFGSGNAQPKFMLHNVVIVNPKVLKDAHVSCIVAGDRNSMNKGSIRAIAFSVMQNSVGELLLSQKYHLNLIVTLDINKWQDSERVQLIIHDVIVA